MVARSVGRFAQARLGNVIQGVPPGDRPAFATLGGPYPPLWGATVVAVFALQGAAFMALRVPEAVDDRSAVLF
jgi:cytochrome bd-type quinol oxidase subunit 2